MLLDMVKQTAKIDGMFYIRLSRKNAVKIFEDGATFDIGKAVSIKEGTDVTLIASGICVDEAMKAAEILQTDMALLKWVMKSTRLSITT